MSIALVMPPPPGDDFLDGRRAVLPDEITVTEAAQVLGVGRPALSQLLNRKAALSPEMALRFEKAFGVKMETLVRMQARAGSVKVKPYQPA